MYFLSFLFLGLPTFLRPLLKRKPFPSWDKIFCFFRSVCSLHLFYRRFFSSPVTSRRFLTVYCHSSSLHISFVVVGALPFPEHLFLKNTVPGQLFNLLGICFSPFLKYAVQGSPNLPIPLMNFYEGKVRARLSL